MLLPKRVRSHLIRLSILGPIYRLYDRYLWRKIRKKPVPHSVGIILDGNRRFGRKYGVKDPHMRGARKVESLLERLWDVGVKSVTLYALSTDNLRKRSKEELEEIFKALSRGLKRLKETGTLDKYRIRFRSIGRIELLPDRLQKEIRELEEHTKDYDKGELNLAIAYGGRTEIVDAVRKIAEKVKRGEIEPEEIDEDTISRHLYNPNLDHVDLIIRTSGEERLSGFLLRQSAYAELFFIEVYLPELRRFDIRRAIRDFQKRERRFGKRTRGRRTGFRKLLYFSRSRAILKSYPHNYLQCRARSGY